MNQPIPIEYNIPTLGGRGGYMAQRKIFQLFARIRNVDGIFVAPDLNLLPEGWMADYLPQTPGDCGDGLAPRAHKCERLWRMGTGCQVAYRFSHNELLPSLTTEQMDAFANPGNPDPVGAVTGGSGYFRVQYNVSSLLGRHSFILDVGQMVELYALQVEAFLIGPPNTILITQQNGPQAPEPATLNGLIVDARIAAMFLPIEAPTGMREGTYTQMIPVATGVQVLIPVPKFATSFRIYQDNVGASSGPWNRWVGPVAGLCNVGTIAFDGRASRAIDSPLGRESTLQTDLNAINDRMFQIQWTIRP